MTATRKEHSTEQTKGRVLYLAFELGWNEWKLAFATGPADNPRLRSIGGRNTEAVLQEIAKAKRRFGLAADAVVQSCYEAGRDGFWLHRFLESQGIANQVVDSSSIEVKRRGRRRKTDRLDAGKLLSMLMRWHQGEKDVWSIVQVPSVADEDRRQLHRDLLELKAERTQHTNRIKGLLAGCGLAAPPVDARFPEVVAELRCWDGQAVPPELQQRLSREHERWQLVDRQIKDLENERARRIRNSQDKVVSKVRQLLRLRGIGANSAWMYVMEFFGWRRIRNRKQLAALAGLTPTPYQSGDRDREQGISKAGNRRLRTMAVEIAWCWLQYQPGGALSQWYQKRFAKGSSRQRRIGIVALARKLLVALWRFLETGEVPAGAKTVTWKKGLLIGPQEVALT
ncbi:MAG TPA: IS110 family transposase [Candidatus Angelobacter sp.]|nr:IS110 family transposase [Candidatus Angelobacter sp.]